MTIERYIFSIVNGLSTLELMPLLLKFSNKPRSLIHAVCILSDSEKYLLNVTPRWVYLIPSVITWLPSNQRLLLLRYADSDSLKNDDRAFISVIFKSPLNRVFVANL